MAAIPSSPGDLSQVHAMPQLLHRGSPFACPPFRPRRRLSNGKVGRKETKGWTVSTGVPPPPPWPLSSTPSYSSGVTIYSEHSYLEGRTKPSYPQRAAQPFLPAGFHLHGVPTSFHGSLRKTAGQRGGPQALRLNVCRSLRSSFFPVSSFRFPFFLFLPLL